MGAPLEQLSPSGERDAFSDICSEGRAILEELRLKGFKRISIIDMPSLRSVRETPPLIWMGQMIAVLRASDGAEVTVVNWPHGPEEFPFCDRTSVNPGLPDIMVKLSDRSIETFRARGLECVPFYFRPEKVQ